MVTFAGKGLIHNMKAFKFKKPGSGSLVQLDIRTLQEEEVLLKVGRCGVCGTDIHIWNGTEPAAQNVILGHEYAGTIIKMGSNVKNYSINERVAVDPNISCGVCEFCRKGKINLCSNLKALGVDIDGGFAEYSIVPSSQLYKIPDNISWEEAAMIEPLACAIHGIDEAAIIPGMEVMIIGGGAIGLMMVQLAHLRGASRIMLSEKSQWRRNLAQSFGADIIFDPVKTPIKEQIKKYGSPDCTIECVGDPKCQEEAVAITKRGGTALLFGCGPMGKNFKVGSFDIYFNELTIKGAALNPFTHGRAIKLISQKRIDVKPLVSGEIGLGELEDLLRNGYNKEKVLKIVVNPEN